MIEKIILRIGLALCFFGHHIADLWPRHYRGEVFPQLICRRCGKILRFRY